MSEAIYLIKKTINNNNTCIEMLNSNLRFCEEKIDKDYIIYMVERLHQSNNNLNKCIYEIEHNKKGE